MNCVYASFGIQLSEIASMGADLLVSQSAFDTISTVTAFL